MTRDYSDFTVYLVGHAHIDLGYRWRWNETVHRIARDTFRGVLRMMDAVDDLTFVQSQEALYEAMAQHYPDIFAAIKARVAEGRWIVADGWCEYDQTLPCGEAIIRQHLIGTRYARETLGTDVTLAWAPDAFSGHVHTLPSILKGCGIDTFLFVRGMPEGMPFFWWEGPDGARVLAYTPFLYSGIIGPQLLEQLDRWEALTGLKEMLVLYGAGDHGGGPRESDMAALMQLRDDPRAPRVVHIAPERFYREVLLAQADIPVYRGPLPGDMVGSLSSAGRIKQRNRQLENLLLTAERFATIATYFQRKPVYPRVDFREAWKTVLRHQFHDELPGTSRAPVFADNEADYDRVEREMRAILETALAEIGARVDTRGAGTPVIVYNPLAWSRSEVVRVTLRLNAEPASVQLWDAGETPAVRTADGTSAIPTQVLAVWQEGHFWYADVLFLARAVPPLGYRLFRAFADGAETPAASDLVVRAGSASAPYVLENVALRVEIDGRTGQVARVYDKRAGREVLAGPGNVLQAIAETPGESSAWMIALTADVDVLDAPESIAVIETGPVRGGVRVRYRYRDSYFVQDIYLAAGAARVDFRVHLDWYERDCCLKVAFPVAVEDSAATFEAPFGVDFGPDDGTETPAQRWIDVSGAGYGASLLNDCRYAFDVTANVMRMTLVRGIPDLDPRCDEGAHDLHYALYPHTGDWRAAQTVRAGWAFNFPLLARQALKRAGVLRPWGAITYPAMPPALGFLKVEPDNVVVTALKVEEDEWGQWSPIVVRVVETEGRAVDVTLTLPAALRFCEAMNHLEEPVEAEGLVWEGNVARFWLGPFAARTLRMSLAVADYAGFGQVGSDGGPPVTGLNPERD